MRIPRSSAVPCIWTASMLKMLIAWSQSHQQHDAAVTRSVGIEGSSAVHLCGCTDAAVRHGGPLSSWMLANTTHRPPTHCTDGLLTLNDCQTLQHGMAGIS